MSQKKITHVTKVTDTLDELREISPGELFEPNTVSEGKLETF